MENLNTLGNEELPKKLDQKLSSLPILDLEAKIDSLVAIGIPEDVAIKIQEKCEGYAVTTKEIIDAGGCEIGKTIDTHLHHIRTANFSELKKQLH